MDYIGAESLGGDRVEKEFQDPKGKGNDPSKIPPVKRTMTLTLQPPNKKKKGGSTRDRPERRRRRGAPQIGKKKNPAEPLHKISQ